MTAEWTEGDEDALTTIQLLVAENQQSIIRDKETAKATWDALKAHHSKLTLGQMVSVIIQIANQSYQEGNSMEEYLGTMEKLFARLDNAGLRVQECIKVGLILRGLPSSYRPLIMALEARDEADLKLAMVKAKLIDEANTYQQQQARESDEQALKVRSRPKVLVCYRCGKARHRKVDCEASEESDEDTTKCTKKKLCGKAQKVRENDHNGSFTFMVKGKQTCSSVWVVDTGATSHLTSDRSAFIRFDKSVCPMIKSADGKVVRTKGIGDCVLQCIDGRGQNVKITLTDVIFAPEVEGSLISIGKLTTKGVQAIFDGERCELVFRNRVIATADKRAGLYQLNLVGGKTLRTTEHKQSEKGLHTWNRDPETVSVLERKGLASGVEKKMCGPCVTCQCCFEEGLARLPPSVKMKKQPRKVFDIVHSDLCGKMTTTPGSCRAALMQVRKENDDDFARLARVTEILETAQEQEKHNNKAQIQEEPAGPFEMQHVLNEFVGIVVGTTANHGKSTETTVRLKSSPTSIGAQVKVCRR